VIRRILKAIILYPIGERQVSEAARRMSKARIRRERELIHAKARELCREANQPIPQALRG
jgi:hypothetical protein